MVEARVGLTQKDLEFLMPYTDFLSINDMEQFGSGPYGAVRVLELINKSDISDLIINADLKAPTSIYLFMLAVSSKAMTDHRIHNNILIIYIAEMLTRFSNAERVTSIPVLSNGSSNQIPGFNYLTEIMQYADAIGKSDRGSINIFLAYRQAGEVALFLSGVFEEHVRYRNVIKRRPIDIDDYERIGSDSFRKALRAGAASHSGIENLSDIRRFKETRRALSHASKKYFRYESPFEKLMRELMSEQAPLDKEQLSNGIKMRDYRRNVPDS